MLELTKLLRDVKSFLAAFGKQGWLKRAWSLRQVP